MGAAYAHEKYRDILRLFNQTGAPMEWYRLLSAANQRDSEDMGPKGRLTGLGMIQDLYAHGRDIETARRYFSAPRKNTRSPKPHRCPVCGEMRRPVKVTHTARKVEVAGGRAVRVGPKTAAVQGWTYECGCTSAARPFGARRNGVSEHRYYDKRDAKGRIRGKTVCTSHVLGYLGIPPTCYHYSGHLDQRAAVLRRHGYAVRSRASALKLVKDKTTVGAIRRVLASGLLKDPAGTTYMLRIRSGTGTHAILLGLRGGTLVDTAPRKRDRRRVLAVHAVWRKE